MKQNVNRINFNYSAIISLLLVFLFGCDSSNKKQFEMGSYGYDLEFLKSNQIETVELQNGDAMLLLAPKYQGRVMTSSLGGYSGNSFGWINYDLIKSGEVKKQFNPIGGEERLWIGPEGGPYSIYFEKGKEQEFSNWQVPKEIDTENFEVLNKSKEQVQFTKTFDLKNALGESFKLRIERDIQLLNSKTIESQFGLSLGSSLKCIGYESANKMINKGQSSWDENTGVLSIWMLSMFNPSEKGVVVIPFIKGEDLGTIVNDDYFGKVPADRLKVTKDKIFFKVDGKLRSKIGVPPMRATQYCGSYDSDQKVLTILWYSKPENEDRYVNSKWGAKDQLLEGDAINSYNDGPVEDGSIMGPFYEIESSSPALFLQPDETYTHVQRIYHISGDESELSSISEKILNVSIEEIKNAF